MGFLSIKSRTINDGYNFEATIPGAGVRPPLTFRFRYADDEEILAYEAALRREPKAAKAAMRDLILAHVKSWDVREGSGDEAKIVPMNKAAVDGLPLQTKLAMAEKITGYDPMAQEIDEKNSGTAAE